MGRIIGIGGLLASGKDTVADYLVSKGWVKFGMSDPLHEAMLQMNPIVDTIDAGNDAVDLMRYNEATRDFGYTEAKAVIPEYRRLLQVFGTEVGRSLFGENVWSDIMKRRALAAAEGGHNVIVTGIRFPNELQAIRDMGGELWWVERPDPQTSVESHASENSVNRSDFDKILRNFGTIEYLYTVTENTLRS